MSILLVLGSAVLLFPSSSRVNIADRFRRSSGCGGKKEEEKKKKEKGVGWGGEADNWFSSPHF